MARKLYALKQMFPGHDSLWDALNTASIDNLVHMPEAVRAGMLQLQQHNPDSGFHIMYDIDGGRELFDKLMAANLKRLELERNPPTEADPGDALDLLPACKHPPTALTCWHADSPTGPVLCVACNCGAVLAGGAE